MFGASSSGDNMCHSVLFFSFFVFVMTWEPPRPSPLDPTLQANPGEDVEEPTPHLPISVKGYKEDVCRYASFSEMLEAESLTKVLPGVKAIEEGVEIYRKFYSEEKERSNGVLAICVTKPAAQPCISLASILSGLSYGGLQRLLGFVHTVGTTVEALPPPRSTLLSSFLLPHNPNVESSTLTDGARALAKHVNRSSSKCWGTYGGSDSNKNKLAKDAISHLIAHCCWQNLHIVPPHGVVYEIRIADGYGARWSEDGTKFVGFLEPYMEDGHSKGWKH